MTELMRQIRAMLDDRGAALLGARVFLTIEECA